MKNYGQLTGGTTLKRIGPKLSPSEELRPFEETGWWYRVIEKTWTKRCHHCKNTDHNGWNTGVMVNKGGMDADRLE